MVNQKGDVVRWVLFVNETLVRKVRMLTLGNEGSASSPPNNFFQHTPVTSSARKRRLSRPKCIRRLCRRQQRVR